MKVGDLVKYRRTKDYGIILNREHPEFEIAQSVDGIFFVLWFNDYDCDWWDGSDLEVISESR